MLTPYERHLLACYLANAASGLHHRDREASALAEWVADRENRVACGRRSKRSRLRGTELDPEEGMSAEKLRRLAEALRDECAATKKARFDRTAQRLRSLAPTADLSRTDVDILELLLRYQSQPIIESMVDDVFGPTGRHINPLNLKGPALSVLLGISANTVHRRFRNDAPLVRSGLVSIDSDGDLTLVGRLLRLATVPGDSSIDVTHLLLGTASASDLEWSDFDHVTADRDHVERLMKGALDSGASGVNVLLYGPPGTGKTQFCKVLAERLGVTLFSVGESDDDGNEPARGERLQELRLAQRLLAGSRRSILLFDEMEDLLCDAFPNFGFFGRSFNLRGREGNSKVFMHRLLEQAPTPTLWTMNNARDVSDAILRRMMFALELRPPTVRVRARMWARQLERHGIEAGPDEAHSLAAEFEATPGVAAGATAAARLGGGDIAAVRHGVRSLSRVLSCERPPQGTPARFDPGLINADTEPATLRADVLERLPEGGWRLIEVKSTTRLKEVFILDVAVQLWVLRGAGLDVRDAGVLTLNREYVYDGVRLDLHSLFELHPVFDEACALLDTVGAQVREMQAMLAQPAAPDIAPGDHCFVPYECPYHAHCTRDHVIPDHGIGELPRLTAQRRIQLETAGIEEIRDVPADFPLTALQRIVRRTVREGRALVHDDLPSALAGIVPPVRHLDFETFSPAIPRFAGTRPYDAIPFLFSVHIEHIEHDNSPPGHVDYLHDHDDDPRSRLAECLIAALGHEGTISTYSG